MPKNLPTDDEHPGPFTPAAFVRERFHEMADDLDAGADPRGGAKMLAWAFLLCALIAGGIIVGLLGGY